MDDSRYLFIQQSKEKKALARNAKSRICGSKSKKCTLPSDYMTKKQINKMNGDVTTIMLGKKISWKEFKALPKTMQEEYLKDMHERYGARRMDIAEMLEVKYNTFMEHIAKNLPSMTDYFNKAGKNRTLDERWIKFMNEESAKDNDTEENVVEAAKETEEEKQEDSSDTPSNGVLHFCGNAAAIFAKAVMLLDNRKEYHIQISFFEK